MRRSFGCAGIEHNPEVAFSRGKCGQRDDFHGYIRGFPICVKSDGRASNRHTDLLTFLNGRADFPRQVFAGHLRQTETSWPGDRLEIGGRAPTELKDIQIRIHQDCGRTVPCEQDALSYRDCCDLSLNYFDWQHLVLEIRG